jgi:hypothetical protein
MIKDIRKTKPEIQVGGRSQPEEDVSVQEVLSEIERESNNEQFVDKIYDTNVTMQNHNQPVYNNNDQFQMMQQQMLQQQMLQQQLLQAQNTDTNKTNMCSSIFENVKNMFKRDNNLFVLSVGMYMLFLYIDVLRILKIDNLEIFENYPILINVITALIFGLTLVTVKPLM